MSFIQMRNACYMYALWCKFSSSDRNWGTDIGCGSRESGCTDANGRLEWLRMDAGISESNSAWQRNDGGSDRCCQRIAGAVEKRM